MWQSPTTNVEAIQFIQIVISVYRTKLNELIKVLVESGGLEVVEDVWQFLVPPTSFNQLERISAMKMLWVAASTIVPEFLTGQMAGKETR